MRFGGPAREKWKSKISRRMLTRVIMVTIIYKETVDWLQQRHRFAKNERLEVT
jgi:hypothetical protein